MVNNENLINAASDQASQAWVLSTKRTGDRIAGWVVEQLYEDNTRVLSSSERCDVTLYCYPSGAKLIKAKLHKVT